jgi:Family of unknown function (DUF6384)
MVDEAGTSAKTQTLDDLMMAMDVVDTLRHGERLIERELNEEGREAELIARLRDIYRQQGIEVSDRVLADGVKALRESRFVYTPPPPGWTRTLFTLWVRRAQFGTYAAAVTAAILLAWAAYYFGLVRPARLAEQQAQIELQQVLPAAIRKAHADIAAIATDAAAKERADQLLADGERAIRDGDRTAMEEVKANLEGLKDRVGSEYTLTIVSRPGEPTGVWRRPPRGIQARNYYLIVEAITQDGRRLKLPVRNEETGETAAVDKFGVRVTEQVYNTVAQDKQDDGIVENNQFGVKKRGSLAVEYKFPFEGGMITKW